MSNEAKRLTLEGRPGPDMREVVERAGRDVSDKLLAHTSPAHSENANFFGAIAVDVEAELAKLDGGGWRPLRRAATDMAVL